MYVYFTVLSSSCRLMKDFCMYIVFTLFFLIIHYLPSSYAQRIVGFLPRKAFLDIYFNSRTFYNFSGYNTQEGDSRKCVSDPLSRLLFNSFKKETQPATTNQTKTSGLQHVDGQVTLSRNYTKETGGPRMSSRHITVTNLQVKTAKVGHMATKCR